jgi:photosystem II stability/assembly factor-like uncharacterized protein
MIDTRNTLSGPVLLGIFIAFLGWYFLASYAGHGKPIAITEKSLTVHDDLLAIDRSHEGSRIAVGKFGLILSSTDGGKNWEMRSSGTTKTLTAVSFADHEHGFVVGGGGTLLATVNGGVLWQSQNSGTKDHLLGTYAVSASRVFAVGAFGTLLSTADGGASWNRHELKWDSLIERIVRESGYVEPNLNAVYFSSPETGWIVGEFGLVLHTRDGGQTWISQRSGADLPQLYAVQFLDDRRGWAVGQAATLLETRDGGQHWSPLEIATKRDLYHLALEAERGVIVGDGVILVSHNGGANWNMVGMKREDRWLSGVAIDASNAVIVGKAGTTELLALDEIISETGKKVP